uniref:Bet v I/Major latex protein domain-containing protein n=2 Tax=Noccaea caerulescens TaxID=107243 RepID=A0A1J3IN72_NOCCA
MAILNGCFSDEIILKSLGHKFFEAYISTMGLSKASATGTEEVVDDIPILKKKRTLRMKAIPIAKWYKKSIDETSDKTNPAWQNPDWYSKLEGTMSVSQVQGDDLVRATWTMEYEKTSSEIDNPTFIRDNCVEFFKKLDESLLE